MCARYFGGTSSTGLRIAGWDYGNTIYQQNNLKLGLTTNSSTANINFAIGSGNRIMSISNGNATVKGSITTNSVNSSSVSYFNPTPYINGTTSTNQASSGCCMNFCSATTAGNQVVFPYLSVACSDIANSFGTIVYLSGRLAFWSDKNFNTRIVIDNSYIINVSVTSYNTICSMNINNVALYEP